MVFLLADILPGFSNAPDFHPIVVHFPIVFWVTATLLWLYALARDSQTAWDFGLLMQIFGVIAAAVTIATGFLATAKTGHDGPGHDLVHVHRDIMIYTSIYALLVTSLAVWKRYGSRATKAVLFALSILLVGALIYGADRGAELVFRYGIGVANETPPPSDHHHH